MDRAVKDCGRQSAIEASLSVEGTPRELHPVVGDEIYRITYEAIRNACTHSGGTRLSVVLAYGQDLTVRVVDDGSGIDRGVIDGGKEGHFGLRGMHERADRIGARLTVASKPHAGTEIVLTIPGRVVFRKN